MAIFLSTVIPKDKVDPIKLLADFAQLIIRAASRSPVMDNQEKYHIRLT